MNKNELINELIVAGNFSHKEAERAVNAAIDIISKELLDGNPVKISGFGTFEVKNKKGRIGTIPGTYTKVEIKPCKTVSFKTSKLFKEDLNK